MRGKYWLKVSNNRVSYSLKLNRCISIIKGDSGTGKTYLLHLLKDYIKNGKKSGVHLSSNIQNIDVLDDERRWKDTLLKNRNYIYFADEDAKFVLTKEFSDLLKLSGSYLVYVTRSGKTGFLQYSISDVYRFESRNVNNKYLTEMFNLYEDRKTCFKPDLILTEDSTSGLDIFKHIVSVDVKSSF